MAIELNINGFVNITIQNAVTKENVSKLVEDGVLDDLQHGKYLISLSDKKIYDINDLQNAIYVFEIEATDCIEYEFSEID